MIVSFRDREAERIWSGERSRRLPPWIHEATVRRMRWLHRAATLADLAAPPGNRLEALKGDRLGQYSVRINDQWRICFKWTDGGPADVEIVDYHRSQAQARAGLQPSSGGDPARRIHEATWHEPECLGTRDQGVTPARQ